MLLIVTTAKANINYDWLTNHDWTISINRGLLETKTDIRILYIVIADFSMAHNYLWYLSKKGYITGWQCWFWEKASKLRPYTEKNGLTQFSLISTVGASLWLEQHEKKRVNYLLSFVSVLQVDFTKWRTREICKHMLNRHVSIFKRTKV